MNKTSSKLSNEAKTSHCSNLLLATVSLDTQLYIDESIQKLKNVFHSRVFPSPKEEIESRKNLINSFEDWKNSPDTPESHKNSITIIQDICKEQINHLSGNTDHSIQVSSPALDNMRYDFSPL